MTQTHNASNWDAHYRSRIGESYPAHCRQAYLPFLNTIREEIRKAFCWDDTICVREEGCGISTITKILAQDSDPKKVEFIAFDYNCKQVANSRANLRSLPFDVSVYQGDHFKNQGCCEIIHAHGVLEHFSDEEIAKVLDRQRGEADVVIHYVPLEGWGEGSYGDERLLPLTHWVETFKPDRFFTFNGGKDAVLIWS